LLNLLLYVFFSSHPPPFSSPFPKGRGRIKIKRGGFPLFILPLQRRGRI